MHYTTAAGSLAVPLVFLAQEDGIFAVSRFLMVLTGFLFLVYVAVFFSVVTVSVVTQRRGQRSEPEAMTPHLVAPQVT